jgi:hypothetical protein
VLPLSEGYHAEATEQEKQADPEDSEQGGHRIFHGAHGSTHTGRLSRSLMDDD